MDWNVLIPNEIVHKELDGLPDDMRQRFMHISELIEEFGPMRAGASHVRHVQGPLWRDADAGERRHLPRPLRRMRGTAAGGGGARVHQEEPEDTATRDPSGARAGQRPEELGVTFLLPDEDMPP